MWSILLAATVIATIVLSVAGMDWPAIVLALVSVVLAAGATREAKVRRRNTFLAQYGSVEHIRRTADLTSVHQIRDKHGEVAAVRAVRKQFPGMLLTEAISLVRASPSERRRLP
jgi:L-lactate permease